MYPKNDKLGRLAACVVITLVLGDIMFSKSSCTGRLAATDASASSATSKDDTSSANGLGSPAEPAYTKKCTFK